MVMRAAMRVVKRRPYYGVLSQRDFLSYSLSSCPRTTKGNSTNARTLLNKWRDVETRLSRTEKSFQLCKGTHTIKSQNKSRLKRGRRAARI